MKTTADLKWICWFRRNLAFICKLEAALSPESFQQVCRFVNEYRTKKLQHGYRLQDRENIEKQILPLLVALDREFLCEFMEILDNDVPKKAMPSGSSNIHHAMDDPSVGFKPENKSGYLPTNPSRSDRIQLKSADEVVHHHNGLITDGKSVSLEDVPVLNPDYPRQPRNRSRSDRIQLKSADEVVVHHNGLITDGKSVSLEDVLVLNPDYPRQPRSRRIRRPPGAAIMPSGSRHDEIIGDVSLGLKKRNEHSGHVTTKRQLVSEGTDCTPIHSSAMNGDNSRKLEKLKSVDHDQLHEHHDDKRMRVHPQSMKLSREDNRRKARAAAFLVNLSKIGDRTLQESIKSVLQLYCDKKMPPYYANKCICMLLEGHKKLLNEFCELTGFRWMAEDNMRSYNGGRRGFRDLAFQQYTYIEEAAKNEKLCSLERDVPLFRARNVRKKSRKSTIALEIQLHTDMLEEKQFCDNLKEKLRRSRRHRWWPGCRYKNVTPNIGPQFQVTPKRIPRGPRNPNDHVATPTQDSKIQASAVEFLAHPHNSNQYDKARLELDWALAYIRLASIRPQVVTPTQDSEIQASAVGFLAHPHNSNQYDKAKLELDLALAYMRFVSTRPQVVTPTQESKIQASAVEFLAHPHNSVDQVVTPTEDSEMQASAAVEFLAHPHNSVDQIVTPTEDSEMQASAVDLPVHPHISNDQTTTIDCHKNDLISEGTSSMRKLESDLSHLWLERIAKMDIALSNVERMLSKLQEHPPNWYRNS